MKIHLAIAAAVVICSLAAKAPAQIAVSGNDGKQVHPDDNPPTWHDDTVATIDLNVYPPKVLAEIKAPAGMIGPPEAVAVAPNSSYAIVTSPQLPDMSDPDKKKVVLGDTVSVIDISNPKKPKVIQTAHAAPGASGVTINKAGTLALVASTSDGSISVFSISHKKLTKIDTVKMEDGAGSTAVVFNPDGKQAYVSEHGGNRIAILDVDGKKVTYNGKFVVTGVMPYGMAVTPDGKWGVNTNLGGNIDPNAPPPAPRAARPAGAGGGAGAARGRGRGRGPGGPPRSGTISLVNLTTDTVADTSEVGPTPEHVVLSPDGKYAAVVVANGAANSLTAPNYATTHGLFLVYGVADGKLTRIASADSGHWCQGATWSNNDQVLLLQCATEMHIEVYKFDGTTLTQDPSAAMQFKNRPGSISTALAQ
jgi:DNA-binding beta-propeller fold protein YncE